MEVKTEEEVSLAKDYNDPTKSLGILEVSNVGRAGSRPFFPIERLKLWLLLWLNTDSEGIRWKGLSF